MKNYYKIARLLASLTLVSTPLFPALAKDIHVPADYATIEAAVKAAVAGDTIQIAAGVYVEQISIQRKSLTLAGEPGAVIKAKKGMPAIISGFLSVPLIAIDASTNVIFRGLTVDGDHLGEAYPNYGYIGIFYNGSSGRVEDCTVKGFRRTAEVTGFNEERVLAFNSNAGTPPPNVQVLNNTFADNSLSVQVRGSDAEPAKLRLTFSIQNNAITGIGPTANGTQLGILISHGASGDVTRNRITDHYHTGIVGLDTSYGVLALDWRFVVGAQSKPVALLPIRYEGNIFLNNQVNLGSVLSHGSQFVNNLFQGPSTGRTSSGILLTGDTNRIVLNQFADLTKGIGFIGDDPDYGKTLGAAKNAEVTANRFCHVGQPIDIEPLVTGVTEQGTEMCPFPPPTLALQHITGGNVQLTWRATTNEFILESTESLEPTKWVPATGSPTVINDQITWSGAAGSIRQFFRLHKP